MGPCQERAGFRGKQVDDGKRSVRQSSLEATAVAVRGDAPEALLAQRPDPVDDVIQESPLALDALSQHQFNQGFPPLEMRPLVPAAVAVPGKVKEHRGLEFRPRHSKSLLGPLQELVSCHSSGG